MDMLSYPRSYQTKRKLLNVWFVIQTERWMLLAFTGCSEFAILMSGSSIAVSQNVYAKAYSGADMLSIMSTEKSIKKHAYDKVKEVIDDKKSND